jgi:hypothetical protein
VATFLPVSDVEVIVTTAGGRLLHGAGGLLGQLL